MPSRVYARTSLDNGPNVEPKVTVSTSERATDGAKNSLPLTGKKKNNPMMEGEQEVGCPTKASRSSRVMSTRMTDDNGPIALINEECHYSLSVVEVQHVGRIFVLSSLRGFLGSRSYCLA